MESGEFSLCGLGLCWGCFSQCFLYAHTFLILL